MCPRDGLTRQAGTVGRICRKLVADPLRRAYTTRRYVDYTGPTHCILYELKEKYKQKLRDDKQD